MEKQSELKRLLPFAGRRRALIYLSWILSAASAVIALFPFVCIWMIVRDVLMADYERIIIYGWLAVGFALLSMLIYMSGLMCSHLAAFRVASSMRKTMLEHITKLPLGFEEKFGSGKLRKIINESSAATETYLAHQLPDKAGALATPAALLVMLFFFDWRLGLLSLLPVVLAFCVMMRMTGSRMKQRMEQYQNALMDMSNQAVEYVRGIPVVKTFGQSVFSFKRFKGAIDHYEKWVIAYTKELMRPMIVYTGAVNSCFAFLCAGAFILASGGLSSTEVLNVIFYIIITPVISITLTKIMFKSEEKMIVNDALQRMDCVMSEKVQNEVLEQVSLADSSVSLRNVSFSYDGKRKAVDGLSLDIGEGQTVALAGPSGGGKTTTASLIARFFDPDSGSICIGGTDVRHIRKEQLMETVSFVFQDSRLIKGTIRDNVRLAKPGASDAEVVQALEKAECMDIVSKFPAGLDTVIGTGGVYLSGGERQRIAIARTMLKNSSVIVLDEATAFSDPDNEVKIQKAFTSLAGNKTVIMIAHRLSTIRNADRIYVLDEGRLAESGSFDELLAADGMFRKMWDEYSESADWKIAEEA